MTQHNPKLQAALTLLAGTLCAGLAGCGRHAEPPAPTVAIPSYTPKYIASQKYKGNDRPYQEMAAACERATQAAKPCGGREAELITPKDPMAAITPERVACLEAVRKLPACSTLNEAGDILGTIASQRVNGEAIGRKHWGKNFVELEN